MYEGIIDYNGRRVNRADLTLPKIEQKTRKSDSSGQLKASAPRVC